MPGTDEPFTVAKYKKELGKPYSKICFYLRKDEEYQSSLLKGFADSVSQTYSFYRCTSCMHVQILQVSYIYFCDVHHVLMCDIVKVACRVRVTYLKEQNHQYFTAFF